MIRLSTINLTELSKEVSIKFLNPSVVPAVCINRCNARKRHLSSDACSNDNRPGNRGERVRINQGTCEE